MREILGFSFLSPEDAAMKFSDFICFDAILTDLAALNKEAAIREIVGSLQNAGAIEAGEFENIVQSVLEREKLGSTGIGRGVGIPHTKKAKVDRFVGTVAISRRGVDFASLDGEKANLLLLFISPSDDIENFRRPLEHIARLMRDETLCRLLKQAKNPTDVRQLLEEWDSKLTAVSA
jgi:PTS system fructose-specific IIA component/PTS system nitrogen regulatory IIA component